MRLASGHRAHRLERGVGVARHPEVVGVDVDGMGQPKLIHRPADRLQDLARGHREPRHLIVERVDVAVVLLEGLHPAGIDQLHAVAAGGVQPPCHRVAQLRGDRAAGLTDQLEQHLVIAHQDQERLVDHRRVAQLGEHLARGQRRSRRLHHGGVAQQRVSIPGGEGGGNEAAGAGTQQLGAIHGVIAVLIRRELARGVDLGPGDVSVDVNAPWHHHHPASVDAPSVGTHV